MTKKKCLSCPKIKIVHSHIISRSPRVVLFILVVFNDNGATEVGVFDVRTLPERTVFLEIQLKMILNLLYLYGYSISRLIYKSVKR